MTPRNLPRLADGQGGDIVVADGPNGLQVNDYRSKPVHARITGPAGGAGADYPWQQIDENDTGLADLTGDGFSLSGTADSVPFREIGGLEDVEEGTKVRGFLNPAGDAFLFVAGSSNGSPSANCLAKLAGLRANECLSFLVLPFGETDWEEAATTAAGYDAGFGGWVADDTVETGDGSTTLTIFRKAEGGMGIRAVGETESWYGVDLGCAGEYAEFAVPYCPPDLPDDGGSGSGGSGESDGCATLADCDDHTLRVRVKCGSCDVTVEMCDLPPFTVPRAMSFSATPVSIGPTYAGTITYRGPLYDVDCYYDGSFYVPVANLWQATIPNPDPLSAGLYPNLTLNFQVGTAELKAWVGNCEYCGSPCAVGYGCAGFVAPEFTASPFKFDVTVGGYHYVIE